MGAFDCRSFPPPTHARQRAHTRTGAHAHTPTRGTRTRHATPYPDARRTPANMLAPAAFAPPTQHLCVLHGYYPKRAEHARTPASSWQKWGLPAISKDLYLYSLLLSDDSIMLRHWLRHYHGLGVRANQTNVAIRVHGKKKIELEKTLQTLHRASVPEANIRLVHAPPSDNLKLSLINNFMAGLPKQSWVIYADIDELFDYPCGQLSWRHPCVAGTMIDQLAGNGNITELSEEGDITQEYPLQCKVRQKIPKQKFTKTILVNVGSGHADKTKLSKEGAWRRFRDTHNVNGSCSLGGIVRHYSMTSKQMENAAEKAALHQKRNIQAGSKVSKDKGQISQKNFANGTCGSTDAAGRCLDYIILYAYMQSRVNATARSMPFDYNGCSPRNISRWTSSIHVKDFEI